MEVYQTILYSTELATLFVDTSFKQCHGKVYLGPGCLRDTGVPLPFFYERLVSSVLGPVGPVHAGPAGPGVVDIVGLLPRPDDRVIRAAKIGRGAVITVLIIWSNLQRTRDAITNENLYQD